MSVSTQPGPSQLHDRVLGFMDDSAAKQLQALWADTGEAGGGGFEATGAIGVDQGIGVDDDFDTAVACAASFYRRPPLNFLCPERRDPGA